MAMSAEGRPHLLEQGEEGEPVGQHPHLGLVGVRVRARVRVRVRVRVRARVRARARVRVGSGPAWSSSPLGGEEG